MTSNRFPDRLSRRSGNSHALLKCCVMLFLASPVAHADEKDQETLQRYTPHGSHRLDLSATYLDTVDGDLGLVLVGYTGSINSNMRVSVTGGLAILEADQDPTTPTDDVKERGLSDSLFSFQYDPNARLTASPWIPDTVGLNTTLLAPTGDADRGLGADMWLGTIGAGWAIDFVEHFWLIPALSVETSFAEGSLAVPTSGVYASCSILWLFQFGGWIGYEPVFGYEFETDEWVDEHLLTIGKMWQNGVGVSVDIGRNERVGGLQVRDDRTWFANLYYQF